MADEIPIDLDSAATTQLHPDVMAAMRPFLEDRYHNPSSPHPAGRHVRRALELARYQAASALGIEPAELIFTSGATEANHLALHGVLRAHPEARPLIAISAVEHAALLEEARYLQEEGQVRLQTVAVDGQGRLDLDRLTRILAKRPALLAIMAVNNETGVCFPLAEIAARCAEHDVPLHVDAVQAAAFGFQPAAGVTGCALSGHKIHGPKGVGLLVLRRGARFQPPRRGGGQEHGRRPGTENTPGIVGLAMALAMADEADEGERIGELRASLEHALAAAWPGARIAGADARRAPHIAQILCPGLDARLLIDIAAREGVLVSSGAACSSPDRKPSHVLTAMGATPAEIRGAIRVSLTRFHQAPDIERAARTLGRALAGLAHQHR